MKKSLLSFLFFLFTCASVWGDTYNYNGAFNSCSIAAETTVSGQKKFTLTMGVKAKNTKNSTTYSSTLTLVLLSSDHTIEGTYSTTDDDNQISSETNLVYSDQTARTPDTENASTFTIEKIGAPDYCYRVSSGVLHLTANSNSYNYTFCYSIGGDGKVDDSSPSHYDFTDIRYTITGTSPNQTLTISGYGAMNNYSTTINAPWYSSRAGIKNVVIEDGVTSVGEYAFYNCTTLVSITVPVSVTSFGSNAFHSCKKTQNIYYAGSPNQWAGITFGNQTAHPYGTTSSLPSGVAEARSYYFNGSNTATTDLVFAYGLTNIKAYTFCNAGTFNSVSIPGSVTNIRDCALYSKFAEAYVNKATAPTLAATNSISFTSEGVLYIPADASNYNESNKWKKSDYHNTQGAKTVTQKPVSGTVDGQSWSLGTNGILTITGSGALTTSFTTSAGASQYPCYNFRYLVDKVVITGGITGLSNILQQCAAVREVDIDQAKVPTASATLPTLIHGGTIAFMVDPAALADASASNLGTTPWTNAKFGNVTLSDNLVIGDNNAKNSTVLANCSTYVEKPITLQLDRSLTKAQYNTFCSPIALNDAQLQDFFGAGYDLEEFDSSDLNNGVLSLNFNKVTSLVAGRPYLLQPSKNVANLSFEDVTISVASPADQTSDDYISFHGTFAPTELEGGNKNLLFLGEDNELLWPASTANIKGFRAYFEVKGAASGAKRARIVMNPEVATGVENGVLMNGENGVSHKILRDGQIIIIRDGKEYNVMGIMMK